MANYWVYLDNDVAGPFTVEQLVRLRGFSRTTQVRVEDGTGHPGRWISPAEIPELAQIFKAAGQMHELVPSPPTPKHVPKPPVRRHAPKPTLAAPLPETVPHAAPIWPWVTLAVLFLGGGVLRWVQIQQQHTRAQERQVAQRLTEQTPLPAGDPYGSIERYIVQKEIAPRWEFERTPEGLYHATVSWFAPDGRSQVFAFEVNLQSQSVRGLNSAAALLLTQGFRPPPVKAVPPKPKTLAELFAGAVNTRREAVENGDFKTVWSFFSQRKRTEMLNAGISESGFTRLQSLTHGLETGLHQTVLRTKTDDNTQMLAAIRQTQDNHPDIFIKQTWVKEDGEWKLDDEEKKSAPSAGASETSAPTRIPSTPDQAPASDGKSKPAVMSLPGLSN